MAVTSALIEHAMALDERRQQRAATVWPDESDIYTGTIMRLRGRGGGRGGGGGWAPPARKASRRGAV